VTVGHWVGESPHFQARSARVGFATEELAKTCMPKLSRREFAKRVGLAALFSPFLSLVRRAPATAASLGKAKYLLVFYTNVGQDPPERIRLSTIPLTPDWMQWKETPPVPVLEPATAYEGVDRPLAPSATSFVAKELPRFAGD